MTAFKNYLLTAIALFSSVVFISSCEEEGTDEDFGPTADILEETFGSGFGAEKLRDVSIDGNGTMYVSTRTKIYKVDASGNATVFAGNNLHVVADGMGTDAGFNNIDLITFDEDNNLFVMDHGAIRKITPAGVVSSIVVNQPSHLQFHSEDLTGNGATNFSAVYSIGDALYTGDWFMMKITGDAYSVFSGQFDSGIIDGSASEAKYTSMTGGFYESETNSIITGDSYSVRRISMADSSVVTITGTEQYGDTDGSLTEARFQFVKDVVSDGNSNLYVADRYTIRKISAAGMVSTIAGPNYTNGSQLHPGGLAIDKDGKFLYITDTEGAEPNPKGVLIKIDLSKI